MERRLFDFSDRSFSDWLGLSGSTLCLLHCLAGPLLFGASVAAGLHYAWLDWVFGFTAVVAVGLTVRTSPLRSVRMLLSVALLIFAFGFAVDMAMPTSGISGDWFHIPGAALLVVGHVVNLRYIWRHRGGLCPVVN